MLAGLAFVVLLLSPLALAGTNTTIDEITSVRPTTTITNTTTTIGPTTTPSPNGVPKFVLFCNDVASVIIQAGMKLFVPYFDDKSSRIKSLFIDGNAVADVSCGDEVETITFRWVPGASRIPFNLTMIVQKLPSSPSKIGGSFIRTIDFDYFVSEDVFPHANKTGPVSVSANGSFFETPGAMGFTCTPQQNISLAEGVIFGVSSLHLETFRNSTSADFSEKALDCMDIPAPNKVVPIIVGVSAAILILLAIVVFLIKPLSIASSGQSPLSLSLFFLLADFDTSNFCANFMTFNSRDFYTRIVVLNVF
uniref:Proto oncogene tyrosine protein kinase receptor n=1 Tax=Echinococcus granulosus TaxID=6210 RepID=A0A068WP35_ECHGR|nr:proto oncogene tyrosine protein kinase receptor [Echinococcus granulosus]